MQEWLHGLLRWSHGIVQRKVFVGIFLFRNCQMTDHLNTKSVFPLEDSVEIVLAGMNFLYAVFSMM